jgi:hypothetical protein
MRENCSADGGSVVPHLEGRLQSFTRRVGAVNGRRSLVYRCSKNAVTVQDSAKYCNDRIVFQTWGCTSDVVIKSVVRRFHGPSLALEKPHCTGCSKVQWACTPEFGVCHSAHGGLWNRSHNRQHSRSGGRQRMVISACRGAGARCAAERGFGRHPPSVARRAARAKPILSGDMKILNRSSH